MSLLHLLEPEELVGTLWHRLVGGGASAPRFPQAAARFDDVAAQLGVFFRSAGGDAGVELKSVIAEVSHHRLSGRLRLGTRSERVARARFNGDRLSLPDTLDVFSELALNELLYFWLAAWTAVGGAEPPDLPLDPRLRDVARLEHAQRTTKAVLALFPGLAKHYARLSALTLAQRPKRALPTLEARIEATIGVLLGVPEDGPAVLGALREEMLNALQVPAARGYRTYLPVPLWGEIDPRPQLLRREHPEEEPGSISRAAGDGRSRRAKRRTSDQIDRKGGLLLHRFEKILTWTEFMNLHRDVEDDDEDSARKAADDHEEIGIGKLKKKAATRLKIDLDLAPADVDVERLSDVYTYSEWDYRLGVYLPSHARVLERAGEESAPGTEWHPGPQMKRRIRSVRRQFEALRPRRELLGRQLDGHDLDMEMLIRSLADIKARGEGSDHVYCQQREQARDLSVAVLIDVSRSTESFVEDRAVIDIEREALIAFVEGLNASGDEAGIFAFSSLRRDRVFVCKLKDFEETIGPHVLARISALRPGFYTRLGAAIRHTSAALAKRASRKRLLLVLTDGKPNDLDHYEGRYGVEDTRRAIQEARRAGHAVFGITIDSKAQSYFPRIFGTSGFAIVSRPARLTAALPVLYHHLIS